jgi:hypothetical protein
VPEVNGGKTVFLLTEVRIFRERNGYNDGESLVDPAMGGEENKNCKCVNKLFCQEKRESLHLPRKGDINSDGSIAYRSGPPWERPGIMIAGSFF